MSHSLFPALVKRFAALESQLNTLDAATGDGDHGATMLKGLRAAADAPDNPGQAFRKAAGGASGSLFGLVIAALDTALKGEASLDDALARAATRIGQMGGAKAGDKTMLDALIPASRSDRPALAARRGADATREMAAKRGRAKYVEGAGVGHVDAGATSIVELLTAFVEHEECTG